MGVGWVLDGLLDDGVGWVLEEGEELDGCWVGVGWVLGGCWVGVGWVLGGC